MQKELKKYRHLKSYTVRLALSIAVVSMVLLTALSLLSTSVFQKTFNKEIEQYTFNKLEAAQRSVDNNYFSVAERACITILGQPPGNAVNALFYQSAELNHNLVGSAYASLRAQRLKLLDFSESINIYYPSDDMIISTLTGVNYLEESGPEGWIRDTEWIELAQASPSKRNTWLDLRPIKNTNDPGQQLNVFTYVCHVSGGSYNSGAVLSLNIDEQTIRDALNKTMFSSDSLLFLVDENGTLLSHPDASLIYTSIGGEDYFKTIASSPSFSGTLRINGRDMVVSSVKSAYLDMYYVYAVDTETYYQPSLLAGRTLMLILIFFLFIGAAFSIFCAYLNASPIRNLGKRLQTIYNRRGGKNVEGSDIDRIEGIFNELNSRLTALDDVVSENRSIVKNTVFTNLLLGRAGQDPEPLIKFAGISFGHAHYAVLDVRVASSLLGAAPEYGPDFIFAAVSQFCADHEEAAVSVIMDRSSICIIVNSDEGDAAPRLADRLSSFLGDIIHVSKSAVPVHIGVGRPYGGLSELKYSYQDAMNALEYSELFPDSILLDMQDFLNRSDSVPSNLLEAFFASLRKNQPDLDCIGSLKQYLYRSASIAAYRSTKAELADELLRMLSRYKSKKDAEQLQQAVADLKNTACLDEFIDGLTNFVQQNNDVNPANLLYTNRAKEYTMQHLDAPLSAEEMARMLSISCSHFSRVFKNTCGENYSEYVARVRMEEAVRMLRETTLPVRTIAERIGYGDNVSYFGRKFKSVYGVTPNEYRRTGPMK